MDDVDSAEEGHLDSLTASVTDTESTARTEGSKHPSKKTKTV